MHLTDEQLNEYLDHESQERIKLDFHLASCADCAARLAALQTLFDEIESLPAIGLSRDLSTPVLRRVGARASLPRSLRLTVALQFAAAGVALFFAAPFVVQFLSPYISSLQAPSLVELFLQAQSQWNAWLDLLSQLQVPSVPEIRMVEWSGYVILLTVVSVSALWLIGNGLLLRNQIK